MQQVIILSPLYNDEASFTVFSKEAEKVVREIPGCHFSFLVVNDGTDRLQLTTTLPLTVVHLHHNIGHQKAIAVGLAYAHQHLSFDNIIIMDCDGEDKPEDIIELLSKSSNDTIVVAKRASRQEGRRFKLFYYLYKLMFLVLTGKRIAFGNFMLLPKSKLDRIVHFNDIWNHLAGALIKSKLAYVSVASHRGKRYAGHSKMNFSALMLHGLGAIGVFIEVIAGRLLIFSFVMIVIALVTIAVISFIRFFTDKAVPGWATAGVSSMLIILLQSFLLSLFTIFLYLSSQGQRRFIPSRHYMDYVRSIETSTAKNLA